MDEDKSRPARGPRGGSTTRTDSGQVKKNLWIPEQDAERLRVLAFELRTSEAEIMRRGLKAVLDGDVELPSGEG